MKKLMLGLAAAFLFAGCNTVTISSPGSLAGVDVKGSHGRADRVITVANDGYFFLWTVPIVAGNMTDWDAKDKKLKNTIKFFTSQTDLQKMNDVIYRYADLMNCDLVDVVINDRTVSRLGLWSLEGWFSGLFGLHPISISGVLVPRK